MKTSKFLKLYLRYPLGIIGIPLLAWGCSSLPIPEELQHTVVGVAKERLFEKNGPEEIESWKPLADVELTKYVTQVGEKIRKHAGFSSLRYVIIDTPVVQAVSDTLGEEIFVTRGMLATIQNEAELACLLGHEIHHQNQASELSQSTSRRSGLKSYLLEKITAESIKGFEIREDLDEISYANFSKDRETEADVAGSFLCQEAGYDPYAFVNLFSRLATYTNDGLFERIRKLKGSHERLSARSAHLAKVLVSKEIFPNQGLRGAAEFQRAISRSSTYSSSLTPIQRQTLSDLARFETQLERATRKTSKLSAKQLYEILTQLSKIVQRENFTSQEFLNLNRSPNHGGSFFMEERVLNPSSTLTDYRSQTLIRINNLVLAISKIGLSFIPYVGAASDFYELVSGKDFFTGETLSPLDRAFTAIGLAGGQGGNLRKLEQTVLMGVKNVPELQRIFRIAEAETKTFSLNESVRHGPLNPGRLHQIEEGEKTVADTFRSGTYTLEKSDNSQTLYRVQSREYLRGERLQNYWTRTKPTGPTQATLDVALHTDYKNRATHWIEIEIPPQTILYEGFAAKQGGLVGGGSQVYLEKPNPSWIKNQGKF